MAAKRWSDGVISKKMTSQILYIAKKKAFFVNLYFDGFLYFCFVLFEQHTKCK